MKLIIGGAIAIAFSILGFAYSFPEFFKLLAGVLPVTLLLGGCLALYVYREMRCEEKCEQDAADTCSCSSGRPSADTCAAASDPEPWKPGASAPVKEKTPSREEAPAQKEASPVAEETPESPAAQLETEAKAGEEAPEVSETTEKDSAADTEPAAEESSEQELEAPEEAVSAPEAGQAPDASAGTLPADEAVHQEPAGEDEVSARDQAFVGNEESMVFHKASCQYAKSKKCTASFTSAEEALSAGYKACGVCKP